MLSPGTVKLRCIQRYSHHSAAGHRTVTLLPCARSCWRQGLMRRFSRLAVFQCCTSPLRTGSKLLFHFLSAMVRTPTAKTLTRAAPSRTLPFTLIQNLGKWWRSCCGSVLTQPWGPCVRSCSPLTPALRPASWQIPAQKSSVYFLARGRTSTSSRPRCS